MLRSTSNTVKAYDFNIKVKDFQCGGQHLLLLRLIAF